MTKKVISFTIDKKLFEEWKEHAERKSINSSKLIERLLRKYLEEAGNKKGGKNV